MERRLKKSQTCLRFLLGSYHERTLRVLSPIHSTIKIAEANASDILMVGGKGIEPLRPCGHQILSLARLPVPPLALRIIIALFTENKTLDRKSVM